MTDINELEKIGLSSSESKVYLTLLELKNAPVSVIAKKAHIHRVTCYDILEYLNKKELVTKLKKNNRIYFAANNPEKLNHWIAEKKKGLEQEAALLKTLVPQLMFSYSDNSKKPIISYFEGVSGIKDLLEDVIISRPEKVCGYVSPHVFERYFDSRYVKNYTREKSRLNIPHQAFIPQESIASTIEYMHKYYPNMKNVMKYKSIDFSGRETNSEISLYSKKMSIINYSDKKHSGVIIESEDLYNIQVAIFNSLWKKTKPLKIE